VLRVELDRLAEIAGEIHQRIMCLQSLPLAGEGGLL
jgi:hypothetical protein